MAGFLFELIANQPEFSWPPASLPFSWSCITNSTSSSKSD